MMVVRIAFLSICIGSCLSVDVARPVVRTNYGKIRGITMKTVSGKEFFAFKGIPYAAPPVGELRLKNPVSPSPYAGVLDGSTDGEDCFQRSDLKYNQYPVLENSTSRYVGDEDCLYLNVYTPLLSGNKRAVMVFIHGGGYKVGSGASTLQGPHYFLDHNVVLVTINYRLDILGFLRADDEYLPGNLGLKDQSAALRWVKENIHHFNGDESRITIFGESAGGASVHFQMMAPRNKGVFQRAISQSGFADCPWAYQTRKDARRLAETLASALSCPVQPQPMRTCLQSKSLLEIHQAFSTFESELPFYMHFKPVLENEVAGSFITERSVSARSELPWIIGLTSGEGIMFLQERIEIGDSDLSKLDETYEEVIPKVMCLTSCPDPAHLAKEMKQFYLGDKDFGLENANLVEKLFTDGMFGYGFHKAGRSHRGSIYRYLYAHQGERTFAPNLKQLNLGVDHGDELFMQFYSKNLYPDIQLSPTDSQVSQQILTLWTNFAKTGFPTPDDAQIKWPDSRETKDFVEITSQGLRVDRDLFGERFSFWDKLARLCKTISSRDEL